MEIVLNLATFAVVLVVLVVVHELGHFLTAKRAGVRVLEFAVGYPPRLFAIRRGETEYSLNLLPLGGFVRMVGEEDPSDPRSLAAQSIPWRLAILSGGVVMNVLLAFVLFTVSAMLPRTETVGNVVILGVRPGSPAEIGGLRPDDVIVSVNGRPIRGLGELRYNVTLNLGQPMDVIVRRDGREVLARVTPRIAPPPGEGATGILIGLENPIWRYRVERGLTTAQLAERVGVPVDVVQVWELAGAENIGRTAWEREQAAQRGMTGGQLREEYLAAVANALGVSTTQLTESYLRQQTRALSPLEAVPAGIQRGWEMLVLFKNDITSMIAQRSAPQVAGPVGIYEITGQVAQQATRTGPAVLLDLMALLSLNLAIINALPIPMLDGGRIMFVLLEAVRGGKRISPDKERFAHLIGAVFLFTLIIAITFNDVVRLVSGESLLR
ncbi:MAG: site-2 protease family protein [Chloroflexota bacterium]|nr:site-2 protease family protein [Dehalococcoidia bacterium]MDW8254389.1 site-2 protease family protein [Chloroflexota bacterium]